MQILNLNLDLTTDSNANRWRQSSPIRTPRGIEQRMRYCFLLFQYDQLFFTRHLNSSCTII